MSRSTKTGKIKAVAKSRVRTTPIKKVEEEKETNPRQDLLDKFELDAEDFKDFTNIEFGDLLYSLETYGVKRTLDSLKSKQHQENELITYTGPQFPFSKLLETKRNEYEYLVNFNPKASIGLLDCKLVNCKAKKSVSFLSSIGYRCDEAAIVKFKCQVCQQIQ